MTTEPSIPYLRVRIVTAIAITATASGVLIAFQESDRVQWVGLAAVVFLLLIPPPARFVPFTIAGGLLAMFLPVVFPEATFSEGIVLISGMILGGIIGGILDRKERNSMVRHDH